MTFIKVTNADMEDEPRATLVTEYKIDLPESVTKKYGVTRLIGKVPHLLPPGEFKHTDLTRVQAEEDVLTDWFVSRGLLEKSSRYYFKFKDNFAAHAFKTLAPGPPIERVRCMTWFLGWTFLHDDIIDNLVDMRKTSWSNFSEGVDTVRRSNRIFRDILLDKYGRDEHSGKTFPTDIELPQFASLCETFRDLHNLFHQQIPNYGKKSDEFLRTFFEYFDTLDMIAVENIDSRFSEETMKYWLRLVTGLKIEFELAFLIQGIEVPDKLRKDLLFDRVLMAAQDAAEGINGAFGIAKDLINSEGDTWTMWKILEKNVPLAEAYRTSMEYQNQESRDMRNMIELLRKRFKADDGVDKSLRIIEEFMDGYILWCSTCPRYLAGTTISHRIVYD